MVDRRNSERLRGHDVRVQKTLRITPAGCRVEDDKDRVKCTKGQNIKISKLILFQKFDDSIYNNGSSVHLSLQANSN